MTSFIAPTLRHRKYGFEDFGASATNGGQGATYKRGGAPVLLTGHRRCYANWCASLSADVRIRSAGLHCSSFEFILTYRVVGSTGFEDRTKKGRGVLK